MWFESLTGFVETSPEQVRENLILSENSIRSRVNDKVFICGRLETPSLGELRARINSTDYQKGTLSVREIVADVRQLHMNQSNAGALFQVASQFNLLEMTSPYISPEDGVEIYEKDRTQGPACAIAAGAGTIYRNYFASVNGEIGQSLENQIDCLFELGNALGNSDNQLWTMNNGYVIASHDGLNKILHRLQESSELEIDKLRQLLRIGIQWDTQVTLGGASHRVSQAYCSALPVSYSPHSSELWSDFARLILEASYEATICTAILNFVKGGGSKVYLTLLGGGVFGNETDWIMEGLERALTSYKDVPLDVAIVSYGSSNHSIQQLVSRFS